MTRTWYRLVFALGLFTVSAPSAVEAAYGNGILEPSEVCVASPVALWTPGDQVVAVIAVDVNADGIRDVAALTPSEGLARLGTAAGIGASIALPFAGAFDLTDNAAGDFNADGHVDLIVADRAGDRLIVRTNGGGGVFGGEILLPLGTGSAPTRVLTAHMNADGRADVVALSGLTSSWRPRGPSWRPPRATGTARSPRSRAAAPGRGRTNCVPPISIRTAIWMWRRRTSRPTGTAGRSSVVTWVRSSPTTTCSCPSHGPEPTSPTWRLATGTTTGSAT